MDMDVYAQPCEKHEMGCCIVCSGGGSPAYKAKLSEPEELVRKVQHFTLGKPDPLWYDAPKPPKSRDVRIAQLVADGKMCSKCLTLHAPLGCVCSRRALHADNMEQSADFAEERWHDGSLTQKVAAGLVFTTLSRSSRRNSVLRELDAASVAKGYTERPSEADSDRLEVLDRFDIIPTWTPPRRNEMNHLPV